ncbi:hypothetical protein PR048_027152 [Dryococelus australis]|uniref:C2H2-type domain-containing protein n=1 Tax=Dryococelus australis TaxID=614101 RepID=A0ABQ9GG55_9NEOP|nr:hypothetical protein PR048_027152 [Dryococelus australis]
MDITEAFRGEDISKTDFFDFVVAPEVSENQQGLQFSKTLKSMGIFIDNSDNHHSHLNHHHHHHHHHQAAENYHQDMKETNNNNLMLSSASSSSDGAILSNFVDNSFWGSAACEKEAVRIETAIFEDLNKFCWGHDQEVASPSSSSHKGESSSQCVATVTTASATSVGSVNNTDGTIYTLTILNGGSGDGAEAPEGNTTWYKLPVPGQSPKAEDSRQPPLPSPPHAPPLDLDSILNIIPHPSMANGHHHYPHNGYHHVSTPSPHQEVSVKVEAQFGYDEGAYGNTKTALSNNNSGAQSLLRSALQGKSFVARYNGAHKPSSEGAPPQGPGDDHGNGIFEERNNPNSAHSVDDLLLSQLDSVSYPEDYEKLKRIANEVAESASQYCGMAGSPPYLPLAEGMMGHHPHQLVHLPPVPAPPTTPKKKYSKSKSGAKGSQAPQSGGVRKERSLHYCSLCNKGFKDKYSVNVHIRTHTGEKPFTCTLCGKSFRQKAHLAKHYQTHMAQKSGPAPAKTSSSKSRFSGAKSS